MATVSLTLEADSVKVIKVKEAFEHRYGLKPEGETDKEFMERHIKGLLRKFTIIQLGLKASSMAEEDFEDPFGSEPEPEP